MRGIGLPVAAGTWSATEAPWNEMSCSPAPGPPPPPLPLGGFVPPSLPGAPASVPGLGDVVPPPGGVVVVPAGGVVTVLAPLGAEPAAGSRRPGRSRCSRR
ncbi:MAG: hypothetical protein U0235_04365 [Polyangiaceae bacterium]